MPARPGDLIALRLTWWPRERSPWGRAALEPCSERHLRRSLPVKKPARTKLVPAPREGPWNWPRPRSETRGLLCRLPYHFLRSSLDRSKC